MSARLSDAAPAVAASVLLAFLLSCASVGGAGEPAPDATGPEEAGAEIRDVVAQVKQALEETQAAARSAGLPELDSVTLTLQTGIVARGGAEFHLLVLSYGHRWTRETTQQMVLTLVPPRPKEAPRSLRAAPPAVEEKLAQAILGAARGIQGIGRGNVPLKAGELSIEIAFVVTQGEEGGARFTIVPIDVDFSGDLEWQAVHKIALDFKAGP